MISLSVYSEVGVVIVGKVWSLLARCGHWQGSVIVGKVRSSLVRFGHRW